MQGHTLFVYIHQRFSIFLEITTFLEKGVHGLEKGVHGL